jgi:hypothetical protein
MINGFNMSSSQVEKLCCWKKLMIDNVGVPGVDNL